MDSIVIILYFLASSLMELFLLLFLTYLCSLKVHVLGQKMLRIYKGYIWPRTVTQLVFVIVDLSCLWNWKPASTQTLIHVIICHNNIRHAVSVWNNQTLNCKQAQPRTMTQPYISNMSLCSNMPRDIVVFAQHFLASA